MVVPGVAVGVHVGRVVPDARPEGVCCEPTHQHEGDDAARRARAGAVGDRRAAAVVLSAAVRGCRARAGRCSAAGGGGRGSGAAATGETFALVNWFLEGVSEQILLAYPEEPEEEPDDEDELPEEPVLPDDDELPELEPEELLPDPEDELLPDELDPELPPLPPDPPPPLRFHRSV